MGSSAAALQAPAGWRRQTPDPGAGA